MFHPSSSDLINEEMDVTDTQSPDNVIPLYPKVSPLSPDTSPDVSPDITPITVADFCKEHDITSDQFLLLRRKAARRYPNQEFKPIREGARTYWVQGAETLISMLGEVPAPKKEEPIDVEIVDSQELSDGSALVIRKKSFDLALPPLNSPKQREVVQIDISPIERLSESLRADQDAQREVEELTELKLHAEKVAQKQAQFQLVELLIKQGYTPDQAVKIAQGANNNA